MHEFHRAGSGSDRAKRQGTRRIGPIVLGALGLAASSAASAGCASYLAASDSASEARLMPAVYHPGQDDGFLRIGAPVPWDAPIVGLWQVEFIAQGNTNGIPDGALIDYGTATWHRDGTEAMVSGGRAPSTGDVCMGVWRQVGPATFRLNHVALAWGNGAYLGPAKIVELVTLDSSGNGFHGHFTITQYAASAAPGHEFDETNVVPPTPIVGAITGKRVMTD